MSVKVNDRATYADSGETVTVTGTGLYRWLDGYWTHFVSVLTDDGQEFEVPSLRLKDIVDGGSRRYEELYCR